MPEVYRNFGFLFFFYSREHEPIHIHVEGEEGLLIYDLIEDQFVLREKKGKIKASSKRKIEESLIENKQLIIDKWNEYFGEKIEWYEKDLVW